MRVATIGVLLVLPLAAWGQIKTTTAPDTVVAWRGAPVATPLSVPQVQAAYLSGDRHFILEGASSDQRQAFSGAGLELLQPLGRDRYFVRFEQPPETVVAKTANEMRFASITPAHKTHPLLMKRRQLLGTWYGRENRMPLRIPVYINLHRGLRLQPTLCAAIEATGTTIRTQLASLPILVCEAPPTAIETLAGIDAISWLEPALPELTETNDQTRIASGVETLHLTDPGLDGRGVNVLVFDTGVANQNHPDFAGRLTIVDEGGESEHSTHVAGTIGGAGTLSDGQFRGMAPGTNLLAAGFTPDPNRFFFYLDPSDIETDYANAISNFGAAVANNSLGSNVESTGFPCELQGDYGVASGLLDAIVRGSLGRPIVIVFAAGNERNATRCDLEGFGDYYSTSPPAANKNTITVGALNSNNDTLTSFSSWGPCDDGRIRPDVCAPGCQSDDDFGVTSTVNGDGYRVLCGTSMSSPAVTGMIALLLQDYRDRNSGPDPIPAYFRALLAHTARDLEQPGPDYRSGYGAVDAEAALAQHRADRSHIGVLDDGQRASFFVEVEAGEPLRLTLAWDDVPGAFNVVPSLVNDLDLRVIAPDGSRAWPWSLDPFQPDRPASQAHADRVNNMEQVYVPTPIPGTYQIQIVGHAIPEGPQTYAVHASHMLRPCPAESAIRFDTDVVVCDSEVSLEVQDCMATSDTLAVQVVSEADPSGVAVLLNRVDESPVFRGSVTIHSGAGAGLLVNSDDRLTATLGAAVATTTVACDELQILNVTVLEVLPTRAVVQFTTNQPTRAIAHYGTTCPPDYLQANSPELRHTHTMTLRDLPVDSTISYEIVATADSGLVATAGGSGNCLELRTPPAPTEFAEEFLFNFDLRNRTVRYAPDGSFERYRACIETITALPVPPQNGTPLEIPNGRTLRVPLDNDQLVYLHGRAYDSVVVGANGYIAFEAAVVGAGGLIGHFASPRVSGMLSTLDPNAAGTIRWQQLEDRVTVTWYRVATLGRPDDLNTFQISLWFNGEIETSFRRNDTFYAVSGLSSGKSRAGGIAATDLSSLPSCFAPTPLSFSYLRQGLSGRPVTLRLGQSDAPERVAQVTLLTLPTQPVRSIETGQRLDPNDLPLTFAPGEVALLYEPAANFVGLESLTYTSTNDLGESGGLGTVQVQVEPIRVVPLTEPFDAEVLDPNLWIANAGAIVDALADAPPTGERSLHLDGHPDAGDVVESGFIDTSGSGPILFGHSWQRGGNATPPGPQSELRLEGWSRNAEWVALAAYSGNDERTPFFTQRQYLPDEMLHDQFRLRISSRGDRGLLDDWFVDDIDLRPSTEPLALQLFAETQRAEPVEIELSGFDPLARPLQVQVAALPRRGILRDAGGNEIKSVPYVLPLEDPRVVYVPAPRAVGLDEFHFAVDNGTQTSLPERVQIDIGERTVLHQFLLDEDPGWDREGTWAFGPLPTTGAAPDPNEAFTGENVFGNVLGGTVPDNTPVEYLTTPLLALKGRSEPILQFRRWLRTGIQDPAVLEVSTDGVDWVELWPGRSASQSLDTSWGQRTFDLTEIVGEADQLALRWGLGPVNVLSSPGGWNLDDIEVAVTDIACPEDLNGNLRVDQFDLVILLQHFGERDALGPEYGDLNGDTQIDLSDLATLLSSYGDLCP